MKCQAFGPTSLSISLARAVQVPNGQACLTTLPNRAEALEPLTGFGREADRKRYTVQHKDTQQHMEQQSAYKATRGTRIHREREKALHGLPARDHCGESDPQKRGGNGEF